MVEKIEESYPDDEVRNRKEKKAVLIGKLDHGKVLLVDEDHGAEEGARHRAHELKEDSRKDVDDYLIYIWWYSG